MQRLAILLLSLIIIGGCTATRTNTGISTENIPPFVLEAISQSIQKPVNTLDDEDFINIEELRLNGGPFTEEQRSIEYDLTSIEKMKNLKNLSIINVKVKDLDFLAKLSHLKSLELAWKDLKNATKDLSVIGDLKNLKELRINTFKIDDLNGRDLMFNDLEYLIRLSQLEILDLSYFQTDHFPSLEKMKNIKSLFLSCGNISDLSFIQENLSLESLSLHQNQITDLSPIQSLKNLKALDISSNSIKNIYPIEGFPSLERLVLSYTLVNNLEALEQSTNLKYLDIRGTDVTSIKPLVGLKNLKILLLDFKNIEDLDLLPKNVIISEESIWAY